MHARDAQCYLLMGARTFQQFMRNVLAAVLVYMPEEISAQRGQMLSAVAAGYLLTQVPGGAVADKIGAKNVVTVALLGSCLACMGMPYAYAQGGVEYVWYTLAFMGLIQGPLFPTSTVFLSKWTPPDERSRASTIIDIGISLGALLSIPAGAYFGKNFGWEVTYQLVGSATLAFLVLWQVFAAEAPNTCWYITQEEIDHIIDNASPMSKKKKFGKQEKGGGGEDPDVRPLWRCLLHPAVLVIFLSHIAFNYGAYYVTNWNPTYYKDALGLDALTAGVHLSMPHVGNLVGKMLNNPISGQLKARQVSQLNQRKFFTLVSALGAGAFQLPVYLCKDLPTAATTFLMTMTTVFWGMAPSGFKANYLDVTLEYSGIISGIGNTLGTVASYYGPQIVQHILKEHNSWNLIFVSIFAVNVVTGALFTIFATDTPVERVPEKKKEA
eukprot:TRINITY_DN13557_c0_g1_i1.p1 TRINITY_DN13557_c0_g1~~TRINITY_DN13557_c0_g1_i1.p1  ORF type:complete len:439 (+),score=188.63 TRINITY_DN13557_c0_g1_i1:73-1389(+)